MLDFVFQAGELLDDLLAFLGALGVVALGSGSVAIVDGLGDDDGPPLAGGGPAERGLVAGRITGWGGGEAAS